jgi:hypothetical protein
MKEWTRAFLMYATLFMVLVAACGVFFAGMPTLVATNLFALELALSLYTFAFVVLQPKDPDPTAFADAMPTSGT